MKRTWPIVAVSDVLGSTEWYKTLLGVKDTHPGSDVFNQVVDEDDSVLLCLHRWGPSGPPGNKLWPSLATAGDAPAGNGLILWFLVDDFDDAWRRAREMGAELEEEPNSDNGTGARAFAVRDPDGYFVTVNEMA